MTDASLVAIIAAVPPTIAATLAFFASRSSDHAAIREQVTTMQLSLNHLRESVGRIESSVERIDNGVTDLRERVARLEGAKAHPLAGG